MAETWHSPRFWDEQHHKQMVKIFDDFIDLALDGVITIDQAILGCKEVLATAEEVNGIV